MSDNYIIQGGNKLKGEVTLSGAKNASIKLLIASLLFDSPVELQNVPQNQDNIELIHLLRDLGASVHFESNCAKVDASHIKKSEVSLIFGSKIRSSFLLLGPLLSIFGRAKIPNPGGCRIGARPIERIISGLESLGVKTKYHSESGYYEVEKIGPVSGTYTFAKPTHTGTEALILASVCGGGEVTLNNCALEPEIDDLIKMLCDGGALITRSGRSIEIKNVARLKQKHPHKVIEDRNEAVTFAALAYTTHGDITITNIHKELILSFLATVEEAGGGVEYLSDTKIRFFHKQRLHATSITTAPHPGYMTDWQPQWGLLMSQASGTSVIHETILESRLNYVQELQKVGAKIEFFQPDIPNPNDVYQFDYYKDKKYLQAIRITGIDRLHNGVLSVHDLRAGAVVVMAALSAIGESIVKDIGQIERGYENIVKKLTNLGAEIKYA